MIDENLPDLSDDELMALARAEFRKERESGRDYKTDAPLRSAYELEKAPAKRHREMTLADLFYDTLKDIYYAERQILKSLPKMARAAQSPQLKRDFEKHKEQTEVQIERLQQVFEIIGKRAQGKTCEAIQGIIAEAEENIEEFKGTAVLDAALISSAQAVEHYEIARYGTLKAWATQLGHKTAVPLLDATLREENQFDEDLSQRAEVTVRNQDEARKIA